MRPGPQHERQCGERGSHLPGLVFAFFLFLVSDIHGNGWDGDGDKSGWPRPTRRWRREFIAHRALAGSGRSWLTGHGGRRYGLAWFLLVGRVGSYLAKVGTTAETPFPHVASEAAHAVPWHE